MDGREVDPQTLETAGRPARIRLTADRDTMAADGSSLVFVTAEVVDSKGRVVPVADPLLDFSLEGGGTLLATCSADLTDTTAYTLPRRKAWKGRAMAVVRSGKEAGLLTLTAKARGLKKATVRIETE